MSRMSRPLSPHLTVYRWPITMALSILHRMTGVALSIGLVVLVSWLESIAFGGRFYTTVHGLMNTVIGKLFLAAFLLAFFFHLGNGVRHLFWDLGLGFEIKTANASAWLVVVATVVMTSIYWLLF